MSVSKVFDSYARTKAAEEVLVRKEKQKSAELEARMQELQKLRKSLELLSDAAREAKAKEIEERADDIQRFRTNTARDLRREREKTAQEILKEIQRAINDYAKANGYSLILSQQHAVLYAQAGADVTDEVLKLLNSRAGGAQTAKP